MYVLFLIVRSFFCCDLHTQEKESVESELSDLKSKLHKLMKDRPELSIPLRRILNISSPPTPSARTPAPANQNVQKDSPPRDVETLLSDEAMENLVKDLSKSPRKLNGVQ